MRLNGLIPARFLTIIGHLVVTIAILWQRDENVKACLPITYNADEFEAKDTELIVGLSIAIGLIVVELAGFLSGVSMFVSTASLVSIAAHFSACVSLAYFVMDTWDCDLYWWIFAFCSVLPAVTEIIVVVGVLCLKKGL